ncbi:ABC transporter ATP-binding protein [Amycolatopsis jiangsuensis]|uniref:Peptide/nickel transport system ATP-binding protein n=1 Tax=Amycolatopsis jiangsuensis TaxID=1181879 RepID=A0A840IT10_9PSEU|nr:ATP-binding cassette domain-containing protein [Amycolatopsis jiangsuensis]MBB4684114.1 peptide/nickel transport system ATP-binding protein [Amycolatopsis jiangsuensis]
MADSITVRGLSADAGQTPLLRDVSFEVRAGEVVTLFGPSGAGKTTIAMAVAGLTRPGVSLDGTVEAPARTGYLPQQAAGTLNPARRVGHALGELVGLRVPRMTRAQRRARVTEVLRAVAFEGDLGPVLRRYPAEFSGGQRTRLALAQVLATRPDALVLDEPTTGLDAGRKTELAGHLGALARNGVALLVVTHDPDVVAALDTRLLRVHNGVVTPSEAPQPRPTGATRPSVSCSGSPAAELRTVSVHFGSANVLREADLALFPGETVGLAGASGAGKSTVARCLAGLEQPSRGTVLAGGRPLPPLRRRTRAQLARVQYVWQEAAPSFDPRRPVEVQVAATATRLRGVCPGEALAEAREELAELGLTPAQAARYPPGLSGGQLQRAALARALLARPEVLLCDEVTTGLDTNLATHLLGHIDAYQRRTGAAVLLISHDPHVLTGRANRVLTVENGQMVG